MNENMKMKELDLNELEMISGGDVWDHVAGTFGGMGVGAVTGLGVGAVIGGAVGGVPGACTGACIGGAVGMVAGTIGGAIVGAHKTFEKATEGLEKIFSIFS